MIDEVTCQIKAGRGGDGHVSFRKEYNLAKGGPDGGDGGNGGSVYLIADTNKNTLLDFSAKKHIKAQSGQPGGKAKKNGRGAEDIYLKVPVGTIVYNSDSGEQIVDMDSPDKKYLIARGGEGGRGNWFFRSATNQTPKEFEPGTPGEEKNLLLKLKVLAQIGLTGFPNAGKSTILSILTNAKPKIADYPFTTLSPNLGIMKTTDNIDGLVIADIPGLIEGASSGKGLGIKFLQHIERCQVLAYILFPEEQYLDITNTKLAQKIMEQKKALESEMKKYNPKLLKLLNFTVINKKDLLTEAQILAIDKLFKSKKQKIMFISAATRENIDKFIFEIQNLYKKSDTN
ncbi:GTPase ObgE [Patescibacteria group bacterium]